MFFTGLLADMPKAVLAGIVFVIGIDLVDIKGLRGVYRLAKGEFFIALVTAIVVCAVGVEQGIIVAIVVSILNIIRRQYSPKKFIVTVGSGDELTYEPAVTGMQSAPGLIIYRYDAELFYANANRFVDDVEKAISTAPQPVEWLVLDASSLDDVDYSAGRSLDGLLDFAEARNITACLARVDTHLLTLLELYGIDKRIGPEHIFTNLIDAYTAFEAREKAGSS
jgi:MFS superfamily sulfate permease-like transporter